MENERAELLRYRKMLWTCTKIGLVLVALGAGWFGLYCLENRGGITNTDASARAALRCIHVAEQQYSANDPGGRYGSLATLSSNRGGSFVPYLDSVVGGGTKGGYTLVLTLGADGRSYSVRAGPSEFGVTGKRYFYIDQTKGAVIHYSTDSRVNSASSPVE